MLPEYLDIIQEICKKLPLDEEMPIRKHSKVAEKHTEVLLKTIEPLRLERPDRYTDPSEKEKDFRSNLIELSDLDNRVLHILPKNR